MNGDGWFVMWGCLCSDVRDDRDDLPETCPCHDSERVAEPYQKPGEPMARGFRCRHHRPDRNRSRCETCETTAPEETDR